jgi:hypothetical protein
MTQPVAEPEPTPPEPEASTTATTHHEHVRTDGEVAVDDALGSGDEPG